MTPGAMKWATVVIQIICIYFGYTNSVPADGTGTPGNSFHLRRRSASTADTETPFQGSFGGGGDPGVSGFASDAFQPHRQQPQHQHQHQHQRQNHQHQQQQTGGFGGDSDATADDGGDGDANVDYGLDEFSASSLNRGPSFDRTASRNVTALVGKTAYLNCRIRNLGNKTVTWIRHRDLHLLTVDKATYTSDQRFVSVHNAQTSDWTLQVRYPQLRDSGVYECQVSTTPPTSNSMTLSVVEPITTIHGSPDLYIDTGSTVNLTCIVRHLPEPPSVIQWTHNNQEINYDSARGGVSVITEKGEITTSYLLIQRARISDSGKYTCLPTHANPQTVNVHVLNGEEPAAIQRASYVSGAATSVWMAVLGIFIVRLIGRPTGDWTR